MEYVPKVLKRFVTPHLEAEAGLDYWRERAFLVIFTFGIAVGALIYFPSMVALLWHQEWKLALLDTGVYFSCIALFFTRSIDFKIKAHILASLVYCLGVGVMAARGAVSVGPLWLFAFPILGIVLLGRKSAIAALLLNAVTMAVFWWIGSLGLLPWTERLGLPNIRIGIVTLNFMFVNMVAVITVDTVIRGIEFHNRKLSEAIKGKEEEISRRIKAEEELRRNEEIYRQTIQNSPNIIFSVDRRGRLVDMNRAAQKRLVGNWSWPGEEFRRFLANAVDRRKAMDLVRRVFNGEELQGREIDLVDCQGKVCNTLTRLYPLTNAAGEISRCVLAMTEITERKQAEQALHLDESRLQAILDLQQMDQAGLEEVTDFVLEQGVRLTSSRLGFLAFIDQGESVLNMHSWSRRTKRECMVEEKPTVFRLPHLGLLAEGVRRREPIIINDYQGQYPQGGGLPGGHVKLDRVLILPVLDGGQIVVLAGVANKGGEYNLSDVRQLTLLVQGMWRLVQRREEEGKRARLEEQLRQAQKMEAIGTLAGGIAHDFNNILAAIIGYTELAIDREEDGEKNRRELENVLNAAGRARDLVRQILTFSRRSPRDPKPLDLNQVVRQSIKMLDRTIPRMVEIRSELAEGLCPYLGDAAQTEQVVINLGINAADAMPDGGVLSICTESVNLDQKYSEEHAEVESGPYLRLTVSDNGQGMDAEMVEKIFDPFFSTKEVGKGTGLGLSTVYGVVKDHGGHITCRSRIGEGTTFDIFLPAYQAESQGVQGEAARAVDSTNGAGETVLVVDDEPALRELGCMVLASAGYCTLQADSGEQALERYQESNGDIDLVLLDVSMPGMGGRRCLQEILKRSPSARIVVASGYATDQSWDDFLREGAKGFVAKPFRRDELLNAVRKALDAPAAKGRAESSSLTGQAPS